MECQQNDTNNHQLDMGKDLDVIKIDNYRANIYSTTFYYFLEKGTIYF
jgi:hypothetical protein